MENNVIIVFLITDLIGFISAWLVVRRHYDNEMMRSIAYCFTLFTIVDFSHVVFSDRLLDEILLLLDLGTGANWFIVRAVVAGMCVHTLITNETNSVSSSLHHE